MNIPTNTSCGKSDWGEVSRGRYETDLNAWTVLDYFVYPLKQTLVSLERGEMVIEMNLGFNIL